MKFEQDEATKGFRQILGEICSRQDFPSNQQNVHTPFFLCNEMLDELPTELFQDPTKKFLTINLEFVEILCHNFGVKRENIWFITDCSKKSAIIKHPRYIGVNVIVANYLNCTITKDHMKFDAATINPPFNNNIDLRFIQKTMELVKPGGHILAVHPAISSITRKPTKRYTDHKHLLNGYIKSIKMFNGNPVFGIGLFYPCQIVHITPGVSHTSFSVEYDLGEEKHTDVYTTSFDITKWGNVPEYFSLEKKILDYCEKFGNCDDKLGGKEGSYKNRKISGKYFVNLAGIRGHVSDKKMITDDFYTMPTKDLCVENISDKQIWLVFETKTEAENMLSYLKMDFSRFSLSILKSNPTLYRGELKSVPYFPSYDQEWTKERITKELGVTDSEWAFIEKVIPPYYE